MQYFGEPTRRRVAALFRAHGVDRGVSIVVPPAPDEVIFVVRPDVAARMPESTLTRVLTSTLRRKVWITIDAASWGDRLKPFPLS
jgi:hypothetical protein